MAHDRVGERIEQLLAHADRSFVPPPFDAAVAEEILGPSGAMLTPHRRLLELANGAMLFGRALHLFGASEGPAWHGLRAWNAPGAWRDAYGAMTDGLVFFAEDAFGDQFAYRGDAAEVVLFEAELGRVVPFAPSFTAFLEQVLEQGPSFLPVDVVEAQRAQGRGLQPGMQLFAWPPLFSPESQQRVEVGHVDALEAMRFRGQLAQQLAAVPPGKRIEIALEGIAGIER